MSEQTQRNRLAYTTDPWSHALVALLADVAAGQDEAWERFVRDAEHHSDFNRRRALVTRLLMECPVLVELIAVLRTPPDAFASREAVRALQRVMSVAIDGEPAPDVRQLTALSTPPTTESEQ